MSRYSQVVINRVAGDVATLRIVLQWDAKLITTDQEKEIWRGVAIAITAAMNDEERAEFLAEFESAVINSCNTSTTLHKLDDMAIAKKAHAAPKKPAATPAVKKRITPKKTAKKK